MKMIDLLGMNPVELRPTPAEDLLRTLDEGSFVSSYDEPFSGRWAGLVHQPWTNDSKENVGVVVVAGVVRVSERMGSVGGDAPMFQEVTNFEVDSRGGTILLSLALSQGGLVEVQGVSLALYLGHVDGADVTPNYAGESPSTLRSLLPSWEDEIEILRSWKVTSS